MLTSHVKFLGDASHHLHLGNCDDDSAHQFDFVVSYTLHTQSFEKVTLHLHANAISGSAHRVVSCYLTIINTRQSALLS
jgi:hypothetical protein